MQKWILESQFMFWIILFLGHFPRPNVLIGERIHLYILSYCSYIINKLVSKLKIILIFHTQPSCVKHHLYRIWIQLWNLWVRKMNHIYWVIVKNCLCESMLHFVLEYFEIILDYSFLEFFKKIWAWELNPILHLITNFTTNICNL